MVSRVAPRRTKDASDGDAQVSTGEDNREGSWTGDGPNPRKTINANDDVYGGLALAA